MSAPSEQDRDRAERWATRYDLPGESGIMPEDDVRALAAEFAAVRREAFERTREAAARTLRFVAWENCAESIRSLRFEDVMREASMSEPRVSEEELDALQGWLLDQKEPGRAAVAHGAQREIWRLRERLAAAERIVAEVRSGAYADVDNGLRRAITAYDAAKEGA